MRQGKIKLFYRPEMAYTGGRNFSKSPSKPKRLYDAIKRRGLLRNMFEVEGGFLPFDDLDFEYAHTKEYIKDFFRGGKLSETNSLDWSPEFANTVRYTNSSLYEAIKSSIANPAQITLSPTSGFHHAKPDRGQGFCTFSGQVIASLKLYQKFKSVGCYFDLDGHFGNSIEDSRKFRPILNEAIPKHCNVNPSYKGEAYLMDLAQKMAVIKEEILKGKIHYIVWCHGADSHCEDKLGSQCTTAQWLACTEMFVDFVREIDEELGRPFPVSMTLFGGYRNKYSEVIDLHIQDLQIIHSRLCLQEELI